MASKTAVCGICDLRHITRPSDVWCSECDEGLCLECKEHHGLSKATRNHSTVPISQYEKLPTNVLEISQFCTEHKEKFQLYCKKHGCPCCSSCVVSDHQKCQDLVKLNDMIRNVKKSYVFHDIEQTMNDMIENIQRIKKDRQNNLSTLKYERKMIEEEIEQTRIKINGQLDNLQKAIMKELYEAESKENKIIGQLLDSIEQNEKDLRKYQENLVNIKQHASDLQTFLAIKQMERDIAERDNYLTSLVVNNKLNRVRMSCKMNDALQKSLDKMGKLGEIIVSTHSSEVAFVRKKETQAQILVAHVPSMSIQNISFVLQSTIDTKLNIVGGCTLLPDGRMLFSCCSNTLVRGFNRDATKDFDISLKPASAIMDITYVHVNNTIAVTGGSNQNIGIIDVETRKVKKTIPVRSVNDGIVSRNNTLIYCARGRGIQMINLSDKSINNIVTRKMSYLAYLATFGDKLYYTTCDTNTVTCCDLRGTIQWEFKDESVLNHPLGISVDNDGNVYVVGFASHNVVVISPDGQRNRQLLSDKDGLSKPRALYYDRPTNQLLVATQDGKAFLYRLK